MGKKKLKVIEKWVTIHLKLINFLAWENYFQDQKEPFDRHRL